MRIRFPRVLLLGLATACAFAQQGKIMRPVEGAALPSGEIEIIATAPAGRVELDGKPVEAEQPFADVFHAKTPAADGRHTLAVVWEGGRKEIQVFVGPNPPEGFKPYRPHPPLAGVECTKCHAVSRRGRFRFAGGCLDCHTEEVFHAAHVHPNALHLLEECGLCHNGHGSTEAAHLIYPKEVACKQCHN